MNLRVLMIVCLLAAAAFTGGCGDKKAVVPTKLDQPIPQAVGSNGAPAPTKADKAAQPASRAD